MAVIIDVENKKENGNDGNDDKNNAVVFKEPEGDARIVNEG